MDYVAVTRPTEADILALVSVAEMKKSLRITHSAEDDLIGYYILAAYDWLANPENGWLNRSLITQTLKATLPGWVKSQVYSENGIPMKRWVPTNIIELPLPPLVSVQSVKYLASAVLETLATDQYVTNIMPLKGRIERASGVTWPTGLDTNSNAVEIAYTAGYGTGAQVKALCPGIPHAIRLLAGDAYHNREDTYAEPRLVAVNRKIINGVTRYAGRYRINNRYA